MYYIRIIVTHAHMQNKLAQVVCFKPAMAESLSRSYTREGHRLKIRGITELVSGF